jgi:peptide/nickel transport system substrate-binding protein
MEIAAARTTPGQTYQLTIIGSSDVPSRMHQITISVSVSPCLIATAAFGSELAPEVQILREFRDQQILQTFAGSNFMTLFNSWYYSFSPNVARYEISHVVARNVIRASLYPLVGILYLASATYSALEFQPEIAVLASGIVASYLIGLVYFALPIVSLYFVCRTKLSLRRRKSAKLTITLILSLIAAYCISEVFRLGLVMTVASAGIVMTFMLAVSALSVVSIIELALSRRSASSHAT